jgi:hypothetical protein
MNKKARTAGFFVAWQCGSRLSAALHHRREETVGAVQLWGQLQIWAGI